MDPIIIFMIILFSLIIIPTTICSALGRKEREQEATQEKRTIPNTASQSKPVVSNNLSNSQPKDDLNDIPFSRLKEYVDAALTVFSDLETPGYLNTDSISYSTSIDILHLILHLSSFGDGITDAISEFIKNLLGYDESPEYWNTYIKDNALDNTSYCSNIPMTLRALYKIEEFVPALETRTDTLCHFFVNSLLLSGKKYLDLCNGGTVKQAYSYATLCYGIEHFMANGDVKEQASLKLNLQQGIKERTLKKENSNFRLPSITYHECPTCNVILHESEAMCPFCNTVINNPPFWEPVKIEPQYEETFIAVSGLGANIKVLYDTATYGRWLVSSRPAGTFRNSNSYQNSYFSATMDEYHLTHPIFSDTYYRAGHYLYSANKLCKGVVPFADTFTQECFLMDPLIGIDITDKYVFQLDNTVSFYKDEALLQKGTYKRKGNLIMFDMTDVNTDEEYKYFLGIYRNQLCLETYVDPDGYIQYISLM